MTYRIKPIDSVRFMARSLSSIYNNLAEGLHNSKCLDCKCSPETFLKCNINQKIYFNKDLIKRFANTCKLCGGNINQFCLMLRRRVYPFEYIESWQGINETTLPDKKEFYNNLAVIHTYKHGQNVLKDFELKHLGWFICAEQYIITGR